MEARLLIIENPEHWANKDCFHFTSDVMDARWGNHPHVSSVDVWGKFRNKWSHCYRRQLSLC